MLTTFCVSQFPFVTPNFCHFVYLSPIPPIVAALTRSISQTRPAAQFNDYVIIKL